jgi:hypothetical protein
VIRIDGKDRVADHYYAISICCGLPDRIVDPIADRPTGEEACLNGAVAQDPI